MRIKSMNVTIAKRFPKRLTLWRGSNPDLFIVDHRATPPEAGRTVSVLLTAAVARKDFDAPIKGPFTQSDMPYDIKTARCGQLSWCMENYVRYLEIMLLAKRSLSL
jgi:hypothetical protein